MWEGTANILAHELIRIMKHGGHQLLLSNLEQRLMLLQGPEIVFLQERLQEMTEQLAHFTQLPETVQTLGAKGLMKKLSDLYESVVVWEHAAKHGEHEQQLAQIYVQQTWKTAVFGEVPLAVKYFR